jgi:hypothetical protein
MGPLPCGLLHDPRGTVRPGIRVAGVLRSPAVRVRVGSVLHWERDVDVDGGGLGKPYPTVKGPFQVY